MAAVWHLEILCPSGLPYNSQPRHIRASILVGVTHENGSAQSRRINLLLVGLLFASSLAHAALLKTSKCIWE